MVIIMGDTTSSIVAAFIGLAGAFILVYIRDIYLDKMKFHRQIQRSIIEKQLENLYSPLSENIKSNELQFGQKDLKWSNDAEKQELDQIINKNFHLASNDLQPLLARIYRSGAYNVSVEDKNKLIDTITKEFEQLRKEYFKIK